MTKKFKRMKKKSIQSFMSWYGVSIVLLVSINILKQENIDIIESYILGFPLAIFLTFVEWVLTRFTTNNNFQFKKNRKKVIKILLISLVFFCVYTLLEISGIVDILKEDLNLLIIFSFIFIMYVLTIRIMLPVAFLGTESKGESTKNENTK